MVRRFGEDQTQNTMECKNFKYRLRNLGTPKKENKSTNLLKNNLVKEQTYNITYEYTIEKKNDSFILSIGIAVQCFKFAHDDIFKKGMQFNIPLNQEYGTIDELDKDIFVELFYQCLSYSIYDPFVHGEHITIPTINELYEVLQYNP